MRRGKEIAQGSHASQAWLVERFNPTKNPVFDIAQLSAYSYMLYEGHLHEDEIWWLQNGTKKVALQVSSENELVTLYNKAKELGLTAHLIEDEGHTEFHGIKTLTAVAIGPNRSDEIDKITGNLKLY